MCMSLVQKFCFINMRGQNGFLLDPFLFLHCGKNMCTDKIMTLVGEDSLYHK